MQQSDYFDQWVKEICKDCGSPTAKNSYSFFNRMIYVTKGNVWEKVWSKVWSDNGEPVGFYFATRCRDHVRLIEIAVRTKYKKKGIGKGLLLSLLQRMKEQNLNKLTFRTPIYEEAINFWLHMGAKIVGLKNNDYEMELLIK